MNESAWVALGLAAIGGVVWAVRVEGAVRSHDKELTKLPREFEAAIHQLRNEIQLTHTHLLSEVHYIRDRIDTKWGHS